MALAVQPAPENCFSAEDNATGRSSHRSTTRSLEKMYKLPDFQHAYTKHPRHSLTAQYTDEAHSFLASHGVDKQLGSEMWSAVVRAKAPELMGFIFFDVEPQYFLWLCKFLGFIFAIDTRMDEGEYSDNPEKSLPTLLGMTLALLWYNPEDVRLLTHMKPLYECITSNDARARLAAFEEHLVHAKNKTKNLLDIEMPPLASAFRELWLEYCEAVPAEFLFRQAHTLQDYLIGCVLEAQNRKRGYQIRSVEEYIVIRRLTACVLPYVICSDLLVARSLKVPQIPNSLFSGLEMQGLLLAINDIIGWHNDLLSFHKEVILAEDGHNLVKVVCEERNCSSYTEAGEIVLQLLQYRIADMERVYEQLTAVASSEYHPAIDCYMTTCRDWVSGTHQWHLISTRYNITGTSL